MRCAILLAALIAWPSQAVAPTQIQRIERLEGKVAELEGTVRDLLDLYARATSGEIKTYTVDSAAGTLICRQCKWDPEKDK